jgi:hypothetical protein
MEETKIKKNIDYSAKAVNLGDHEPVKIALAAYRELEGKATKCRTKLQDLPEYKELEALESQLNDLRLEVIAAIDEYGSYQDIENGWYAVKQRKESKSYIAESFVESFPKYIPAVIEQAINVKALEGLIKGKLITEDELKEKGVMQITENFAYIIK